MPLWCFCINIVLQVVTDFDCLYYQEFLLQTINKVALWWVKTLHSSTHAGWPAGAQHECAYILFAEGS